MNQDGVSQVLVLETGVKNEDVMCMVCLPLKMKQKSSSCKSSVHAQGSIMMVCIHPMHWHDNEGDLEVTAPMAETYAKGTRTRAHGDAVVRKPMAL